MRNDASLEASRVCVCLCETTTGQVVPVCWVQFSVGQGDGPWESGRPPPTQAQYELLLFATASSPSALRPSVHRHISMDILAGEKLYIDDGQIPDGAKVLTGSITVRRRVSTSNPRRWGVRWCLLPRRRPVFWW